MRYFVLQDTMYIKTLGACFKKKIPEKDKFKLEELKSPKNAILLDSGHIANSKVLVNVYAAEEVKNGKKGVTSDIPFFFVPFYISNH